MGDGPLGCSPPYHLVFRKKGPEYVYHAGCGGLCHHHHHVMEPQFPHFVKCAIGGHPMQRAELTSLDKMASSWNCDDCDIQMDSTEGGLCLYCPTCYEGTLAAVMTAKTTHKKASFGATRSSGMAMTPMNSTAGTTATELMATH